MADTPSTDGKADGEKSAKGGEAQAWRLRTRLVRGGLKRSSFRETCEGLFLTSGFVYEAAEQAEAAFKGETERFIYSRFSNPTVAMFEERMCLIEGAEAARATASGMAAVFASLMCQLKAGDRIVSSRALFGSCQYIVAELLPRYGIESDIVVYSATKHIDGQGRSLGGAILADATFVEEELQPFLRHTGPALSPFNAWLLLKGLETLELRVARHCAGAGEIAAFLSGERGIRRVIYSGLPNHPQHALAKAQMKDAGSSVSFEVDGGKKRAFRFLNALKLIDISNNLGDAKSLITHPATTTHQRLSEEERAHLGITGALVRLSVGLEDVEDIKEDLAQALAAA